MKVSTTGGYPPERTGGGTDLRVKPAAYFEAVAAVIGAVFDEVGKMVPDGTPGRVAG